MPQVHVKSALCLALAQFPVGRLIGNYVAPSGIQEANDCIVEIEQLGTPLAKKATIEFPVSVCMLVLGCKNHHTDSPSKISDAPRAFEIAQAMTMFYGNFDPDSMSWFCCLESASWATF